jgi:hypothetical protein
MNLTASFIKKASNISDSTKLASTICIADLAKPSYERDDILSHSLALTDHIFGLYAVELWRYDEGNGNLVTVPLGPDEETGGGSCSLLIKRMTQEADPSNAYSTPEVIKAYLRLTDPSCNDFLPATAIDVGVGLPGVLWSESASSKGINGSTQRHSVSSKRHLTQSGSRRHFKYSWRTWM